MITIFCRFRDYCREIKIFKAPVPFNKISEGRKNTGKDTLDAPTVRENRAYEPKINCNSDFIIQTPSMGPDTPKKSWAGTGTLGKLTRRLWTIGR